MAQGAVLMCLMEMQWTHVETAALLSTQLKEIVVAIANGLYRGNAGLSSSDHSPALHPR